MCLERIAKNCPNIASIDNRTFYINPSNTIVWVAPTKETTKGDDIGIKSLARLLESYPYDSSIRVPLKLLKNCLKMGKAYNRMTGSSYCHGDKKPTPKDTCCVKMPSVEYWQISFRLGKIFFMPFDDRHNPSDFMVCLERGYVGPNKDLLLSNELLREAIREIPDKALNTNIDVVFVSDRDSPLKIAYNEDQNTWIEAIIAPRILENGEYSPAPSDEKPCDPETQSSEYGLINNTPYQPAKNPEDPYDDNPHNPDELEIIGPKSCDDCPLACPGWNACTRSYKDKKPVKEPENPSCEVCQAESWEDFDIT